MARKPVHRDLPSSTRLANDFSGFDEKLSKQFALTTHLRKIARRLQKTKTRPFYSMREVMEQFGVPLRTVALAYETLEHEGLLNRRRSSQTLLVGKKSPREKPSGRLSASRCGCMPWSSHPIRASCTPNWKIASASTVSWPIPFFFAETK